MQREPGQLERRLLGALLLSVVLHAFLMANLKPASAQFAGNASSAALHVRLIEPAPGASGATPAALSGPKSPADARKPEAAARKPGFDERLVKSYLDGADPRPGNLPDGRDAAVDLDLPLLNQYYTAQEVDQRAVALEEIPLQNPWKAPAPENRPASCCSC